MASIANPQSRAILFDVTRCIGCRSCAKACKEAHGFPGTGDETELDAVTYTVVLDEGNDRYLRRMCMHCDTPSCVSACPVGALEKTALGPVTYDGAKCMGCRYCMVACPFGVPRYEWSKANPVVRKCDGCIGRRKAGKPTACAEACPAEATVEGTREQLLAEARRRIAESPGKYHPAIYGEKEVGGTNVLVLSPVPFDQLGLKVGLGAQPLPNLTWAALSKIPKVVGFGCVGLSAIYWITHRRQEVAAAECRGKENHR
ncbi:MAG TPA: 4Fe-4S dicluster domain-containing protein [Vicinamibacteria bacterium]|nr:4Fe-4S dicluster domain-containing protein [Vicinamibacteria bacterium]